jgi:anti-sigma-K factor RskA
MAVQAHGEVLVQLLAAWEQRDPEALPTAQALGSKQAANARPLWRASLATAPVAQVQAGAEALLRLEMAAEVPTPAELVDARRAFQLKLLTRRNDPPPAQTWAQDAATVFASGHEPGSARRLQTAFKVLLRR